MLHWMRGRKMLLAELVESREQCVATAGLVADAVKERDRAWEQRDNACNLRDAAVKQRDDAWAELAALQGGLIKDNIRDYRPLSLRSELLREKARADALAQRVDELQRANMAHDRR